MKWYLLLYRDSSISVRGFGDFVETLTVTLKTPVLIEFLKELLHL